MPEHPATPRPVVVPYVPAGQLVHALDPAEAYFAAEQIPVHVESARPVVAPYWPATQLVHELKELAAAKYPFRHARQLMAPVPD